MTSAFLPFDLEERSFFVEAPFVRAILGPQTLTEVPHATRRFPGVFPYNGRAIPLIDAAQVLELQSRRTRRPVPQASGRAAWLEDPRVVRPRTIVLELGDEILGLSVDDVREVVHLDENRLKSVHAYPHPFARAELEESDGVTTVLDLPALVQGCF